MFFFERSPLSLKLILFLALSFIVYALPATGHKTIAHYGDQRSLQVDQQFLTHRLVGQPLVDKFRLRTELSEFVLSDSGNFNEQAASLSIDDLYLLSFVTRDTHFRYSITSQAPPAYRESYFDNQHIIV